MQMTFDEFNTLAGAGTIVPVYKKVSADYITPVMAYLKLREQGTMSFLLESAIRGEQLGRYSFLAQNPYKILSSNHGRTIMSTASGNRVLSQSFFNTFKEELAAYRNIHLDHLPRLTCGAVGFCGYEMVSQLEKLPVRTAANPDSDDAVMAFYDTMIAFDHLKNEVVLIANAFVDASSDLRLLYENAVNRLSRLLQKLNAPAGNSLTFAADPGKEKRNFNRKDFKAAVEQAREHIFAGDIFQVVLSQKFRLPFTGDAFQVYRGLRSVNPSPYMFYLDFIRYQLIGASPESVISSSGDELEIIPIAGTRPRGNSAQEDGRLAAELLDDPKENAEHIMLVDLARNDMSRVSEFGSVRVDDFRTIEKYSHVMHIISRVHGLKQKHQTAVDAFMAAFPAGTVSGAPKIKAMEIIHQLEPERRGFYAGAIGYFDFSGNMDMAIAIRTIEARDNLLTYQAGAGIVADSQADREFEETLNKSQALRQSIEQASGGIHDFVH